MGCQQLSPSFCEYTQSVSPTVLSTSSGFGAHREVLPLFQDVQQICLVGMSRAPQEDTHENRLIPDSSGRKAGFLWGVVTFGICSLTSSLMRNQIAFFVFRGVMGIGAAMVAASSMGMFYGKPTCVLN
jgi:hypothetical protein